MIRFIIVVVFLLCCLPLEAQITVISVRGEVMARHGVTDQWLPVQAGDVLKPDDSMKSGKRSSATIVLDVKGKGSGAKRRVVIPENVILDLSDLRELTREELALKLAMENVRAVPDKENNGEWIIPQTTIIHGEQKEGKKGSEALVPEREIGLLRLNGTRVLYEGGYFATCALKVKGILRLYPEFHKRTDARLMVASALEKVKLYGEALVEYKSLAREELSPKDRIHVEAKIEQLTGG